MSAGMESGMEGTCGRYFAFYSHVSRKRNTLIGRVETAGVRVIGLDGC